MAHSPPFGSPVVPDLMRPCQHQPARNHRGRGRPWRLAAWQKMPERTPKPNPIQQVMRKILPSSRIEWRSNGSGLEVGGESMARAKTQDEFNIHAGCGDTATTEWVDSPTTARSSPPPWPCTAAPCMPWATAIPSPFHLGLNLFDSFLSGRFCPIAVSSLQSRKTASAKNWSRWPNVIPGIGMAGIQLPGFHRQLLHGVSRLKLLYIGHASPSLFRSCDSMTMYELDALT